MVIDARKAKILEWTLTQRVEQLPLGLCGLYLTGGQLVQERFQLGRIHWCSGGKRSVLLPGFELDANIIDCAK